ncbi:hypothetical protein BUL40_15590 [Croceivirga radicis]|uniref:Uncharacterized protein n=1 Tax=Croceivirga radicis TaxID=1929488 RepID=A0A1V6LN28_9FLAO|nr:hypothetical protein [Croceivirga radicis]OQD41499.1 hypothetical protein BUL40_15590 [Croceivirga radicis]
MAVGLTPNILGGTQPTTTTGGTSGGGLSGVLGMVSSYAGVAKMLGSLVSSETVAKTIGQALKDGFDCWGATWTPTRAETELPDWINTISAQFEQALSVEREDLQESLNQFFKDFWFASKVNTTTLQGWLGWRYDSAKDCTLRGLQALEKGIDSYINDTLVPFVKNLADDINADIQVNMVSHTLYRYHDRTDKPYQKIIPSFTIKLKSNVSEDLKDITQNKTVQMGGLFLGFAAVVALLFTRKNNKNNSIFKLNR